MSKTRERSKKKRRAKLRAKVQRVERAKVHADARRLKDAARARIERLGPPGQTATRSIIQPAVPPQLRGLKRRTVSATRRHTNAGTLL